MNLDDFEFRWVNGTDEYILFYKSTKIGEITPEGADGRRSVTGLEREHYDMINNSVFWDHAKAVILAHQAAAAQDRDIPGYYAAITSDA